MLSYCRNSMRCDDVDFSVDNVRIALTIVFNSLNSVIILSDHNTRLAPPKQTVLMSCEMAIQRHPLLRQSTRHI